MTPFWATVSLFAMVIGAWFAGYAVEKFLMSKHCWRVIRRAAYTVLVLSLGRAVLGLFIRAFA